MNHADPQSTTRRDAIKLGLLAGAGVAVGRGAPLFGEVPTSAMLWGAALVVSAGLFIIWREHRLGLERGKARKVMTPQG